MDFRQQERFQGVNRLESAFINREENQITVHIEALQWSFRSLAEVVRRFSPDVKSAVQALTLEGA